MIDQPNNSITFGKEIIRLDKEGFHYRGQFIADAGEAHRLMVEFLRQNTKPEPQGPTDEELLSIEDLQTAWDAQADAFNSWNELGIDEIIWWAQRQALARWGRPAIEPVP